MYQDSPAALGTASPRSTSREATFSEPRVTAPNSLTLWQRFTVSYDFPVHFTQGLFEPGNLLLRDTLARLEPAQRQRLLVFIDNGVLAGTPSLVDAIEHYCDLHAAHLDLVCTPVVVQGGETIKQDGRILERLRQAVFDHRIDRHSHVIGIGGGALLDAVGLVAATAHRGIRHTRIPTTVLAQNDSGVGVKNGVNAFGQKNYMGTFAPPFAVLNDHRFINTLPRREKIAGMAEALKVALIRDAGFFTWLENNAGALQRFDTSAMRHMIEHCAHLHMRQIGQGGDPFESGSARPLDYGHWAAHRLEVLSEHQLRHGEAVAIGMALDARYSVLCGLLDQGDEERVCQLIDRLGLPLWHSAMDRKGEQGESALLQGIVDFQEHLGGRLTITLLEDIGRGVEVHTMSHDRIAEAIDWLRRRADVPVSA